MKEPNYFITTTGKAVAIVFKSGSSAIGKALAYEQYPDRIPNFVGRDPSNDAGWQAYPPKDQNPSGSVIVPVRDPVERFRSACSQFRIGNEVINSLLDLLEAGESVRGGNHFAPTSRWLCNENKLFKFPEHIAELAAEIGVTEIPSVNDSESNNPPKPDLTPEQLARVEAIYADDIALFNSITEAGQVYVAPPVPVTTEDVAQARSILSSNAAAKSAEPIFVNGVMVKTDPQTVQELVGMQTAMGRRTNLTIDYHVRLQNGATAWTKLNAAQIGGMIDALSDNRIAIAAAHRAKDEAILACTTKAELEAIDLTL